MLNGVRGVYTCVGSEGRTASSFVPLQASYPLFSRLARLAASTAIFPSLEAIVGQPSLSPRRYRSRRLEARRQTHTHRERGRERERERERVSLERACLWPSRTRARLELAAPTRAPSFPRLAGSFSRGMNGERKVPHCRWPRITEIERGTTQPAVPMDRRLKKRRMPRR